MDSVSIAWVCALVLGAAPLLVQLIRNWNELIYVVPLRLRKKGDGSRRRLPPGNMGLPFIGETLRFLWYFKVLGRPDDFISSKKEKYGEGVGLYRTHLFGAPSIIACSPASTKLVLQAAEDFTNRWPEPELVGRTALVSVEGKQHTRLRNFIVNAINKPDALRRIAQTVQPRVVAALQEWAAKGVIQSSEEAKKVTLENIGVMFASIKPGPMISTLDKLFTGLLPGLRAYPLNFPGTAFHHAIQCRRKLNTIFQAELDKKKKLRESGCHETNDLMDGLLEVKDEEGNHLTDTEVLDNIISFVVAGYESTALSTMWGLIHLSKSPDVLRKLREENNAIRKAKKGEFITMDDISKMKYTAKVVEETIRMANVAPIVFRGANKDVEYKGYLIPKGWQVLAWVRSLHTDPNNFEDPLCFNPDRWDNPAKPGTFQVFGGGPRICAGNMLARINLTIILHHLSTGYKWKLVDDQLKMTYLPHPKPIDGAVMEFQAI